MAEYERVARLPGWATGICEDYRASATVDLEHDRQGEPPASACACRCARCGASAARWAGTSMCWPWRAIADQVDGGSLPGAHYLAEEIPDEVLREAAAFFGWA